MEINYETNGSFTTELSYVSYDEDDGLRLDSKNYRRAVGAIAWCIKRWGKDDNSIWRYTDRIDAGKVSFEFINEEMRVEFLLVWM